MCRMGHDWAFAGSCTRWKDWSTLNSFSYGRLLFLGWIEEGGFWRVCAGRLGLRAGPVEGKHRLACQPTLSHSGTIHLFCFSFDA